MLETLGAVGAERRVGVNQSFESGDRGGVGIGMVGIGGGGGGRHGWRGVLGCGVARGVKKEGGFDGEKEEGRRGEDKQI